MAKFYAMQIRLGAITMEDVPERLKTRVLLELASVT